jgi:redox-sensitive bicupin YhaK (pirin superfamily)
MARRWRRAAWRSWPTPRCGRRDASTDEASRFILIAGQPLNEPIAQYGPFVMNTQAEIFAAVEDFRAGKLGEEAQA